MSSIDISLVKKLRSLTNCGVAECKKALVNSAGNLEVAVDYIRKTNNEKCSYRCTRSTTQGAIVTKTSQSVGVMIEVSCETDFVAKNQQFVNFCNQSLEYLINDPTVEIKILRKEFEHRVNTISAEFQENIHIKRVAYLQGPVIGSYCHNKKIGVLVSLATKRSADKELAKHIAMHIAATDPVCVQPSQVDPKLVAKELKIQQEIVSKLKKPEFLSKKIVDGKIQKFLDDISLTKQSFVLKPSCTVEEILYQKQHSIINFRRFDLGQNPLSVQNSSN